MLGVWSRRRASSLFRRSLIFPVSWRLCFFHLIRILSVVAGQAGVAEAGVAGVLEVEVGVAAVLEVEVAVGVAAVVGVAVLEVEVGGAGPAAVVAVEAGGAALVAAVEAAVEAGPVAALARGGAQTSPKIL
jgi:hypothetical protein